jgi:acetate kinase
VGAVLAVNAGSSSLKVASFPLAARPAPGDRSGTRWRPAWTALAERLGGAAAGELRIRHSDGRASIDALGVGAGHVEALAALLAHGELLAGAGEVVGVGHRIVHGGVAHAAPARIDDELLASLEALEPLAPLHQPHNLAGVRAARAAFPQLAQIACFDTAFHAMQPELNRRFALPAKWHDAGVRRYGFHGLSYESIVATLRRSEPTLAGRRLVIAHLGNGASLCAVDGGRSVATTMSFSPLDGLTMGTRTGQIDAAVVFYLVRSGGLSLDGAEDLLFRRSGLLGISGLSSDMRELHTSPSPAARLAVDHFVEQVVQQTGRMAAALRGIDALVFSGGIGENAAWLRERVAASLEWLQPPPRVLVVPTDEEAVIAGHVAALRDASSVPSA